MLEKKEQEISWPKFLLPPVNLNVLQSAYNFYSDDYPEDEAPPNGGLEEDDAL